MAQRIKKGDTVYVISGGSKYRVDGEGKEHGKGAVLTVNRTKNTVTVEGVNLISKAVRPSQKHNNGGIIKIEGPIHISNVMLEETYLSKKKKNADKA